MGRGSAEGRAWRRMAKGKQLLANDTGKHIRLWLALWSVTVSILSRPADPAVSLSTTATAWMPTNPYWTSWGNAAANKPTRSWDHQERQARDNYKTKWGIIRGTGDTAYFSLVSQEASQKSWDSRVDEFTEERRVSARVQRHAGSVQKLHLAPEVYLVIHQKATEDLLCAHGCARFWEYSKVYWLGEWGITQS